MANVKTKKAVGKVANLSLETEVLLAARAIEKLNMWEQGGRTRTSRILAKEKSLLVDYIASIMGIEADRAAELLMGYVEACNGDETLGSFDPVETVQEILDSNHRYQFKVMILREVQKVSEGGDVRSAKNIILLNLLDHLDRFKLTITEGAQGK